jgi:hypothetical protein
MIQPRAENTTRDSRKLHPSRAPGRGPIGRAGGDGLVEVRSRFDGSWCGGFEVAEELRGDDGAARYRVRRISDGRVLPECFGRDEIARDRTTRFLRDPSSLGKGSSSPRR